MSNKEYRRCCDCGRDSNEVPFYRYNSGSLYKRCKRCHNLYSYLKRLDNPEAMERVNRISKEWNKRNKEKRVAYSKVYYAIQKGTLIKPSRCEICGRSGRIEAHHEDYAEPYEVKWLCPLCHSELHYKSS